jgi:hypothetical protein
MGWAYFPVNETSNCRIAKFYSTVKACLVRLFGPSQRMFFMDTIRGATFAIARISAGSATVCEDAGLCQLAVG